MFHPYHTKYLTIPYRNSSVAPVVFVEFFRDFCTAKQSEGAGIALHLLFELEELGCNHIDAALEEKKEDAKKIYGQSDAYKDILTKHAGDYPHK